MGRLQAWLTAGIAGKRERDVGNGNQALSLPDDESVIELFCHSCGRDVPSLKIFKTRDEVVTYIPIVVSVFRISTSGDR